MFTIELLPGDYGDALWIEYGDEQNPSRILIDGGAPKTGTILREKINALPVDRRHFDLVVVSHIDLDHISGILELFEEDTPEGLKIEDFWFNGFKKLPDPDGVLGPKQGERLSFWIGQHEFPYNIAFDEKAVMVPDDLSVLPVRNLPQGMKITLLSPTENRLLRLRGEWEKIIEGIELEPGDAGAILAGHPPEGVSGVLGDMDVDVMASIPFKKDTSKPNGSSIAFVAEHDGKKVLFTGDSFAPDLIATIDKLLAETGKNHLELDAWKLAHHGGKKNTSADLIEKIRCRNFLVPTSGARYHHPNAETLARILVSKDEDESVTFHFNYRSDDNEVWDDEDLRSDWNYQTRYPDPGSEGMKVNLD